MKIQTEKGKEISLTKADFLSSGGEGDIYVKNNDAYKIYQDNSKMLPRQKIIELSKIKNPNVIVPKDILLNTRKKPIGYSMRFIPNTTSLVSIFTKAARERENISHETMRDLVIDLQKIVSDVHKENILIVDLNEMNFLINEKFNQVYAIDTDSYQTPSFPATAIMESIRDRHSQRFSKETDWFSFAIISFQMFVGIHPFKGKYPGVKTLDERMIKNISVLNKKVKTPHVCYPFGVIPKSYYNWYEALFENGKRVPPPNSFDPVIIEISTRIISKTDNFDINEISSYDEDIIDVQFFDTTRVRTKNYLYLTQTKKIKVEQNSKIGCFPVSKKPIKALIENGKLILIDLLNKKEIPNQLYGSEIMVHAGNFYLKNNDSLILVDIININDTNILIAPKTVANILPQATKIFDGCLVQNLLGSFYFSIFPEPTKHKQLRIKELDSYRIIDAKYENRVLLVEVFSKGKYKRATVKFDKKFDNYEVFFSDEDVSAKPINLTVLYNGIAVSIINDGELHVFSNNLSADNSKNNTVKIINDSMIGQDMKLCSFGTSVYFAKNNKLFSLRMK